MIDRDKDMHRIFSSEKILISMKSIYERPVSRILSYGVGLKALYSSYFVIQNATHPNNTGRILVFKAVKCRYELFETEFFKELEQSFGSLKTHTTNPQTEIMPEEGLDTGTFFSLNSPEDILMFKLKYSEYL